jgi:hypothetical protein
MIKNNIKVYGVANSTVTDLMGNTLSEK